MSYEEKRIKVKNYGVLPGSSPLLVDIPGTGGRPRKLHTLAAAAFREMAAEVKRALGIELQAASGWRRHRWRSWEHYEETIKRKYGSVRQGRRWLAYNSPHETGLAVDFGVGGLEPSRKTAEAQRQTELFAWLKENAYRFGWHPYKVEPWHWEFPVSKAAWGGGVVEGQTPEQVPEGLGGTRGYTGPISFGDGCEVDEEFEGIEDIATEEDALWFADADAERPSARASVELPRAGEISGELELGDRPGLRLSFHVRWELKD